MFLCLICCYMILEIHFVVSLYDLHAFNVCCFGATPNYLGARLLEHHPSGFLFLFVKKLKHDWVFVLQLLDRVFNILRENNPDLAGDRRRTVMRPPQVLREGTKKTVFVNFMDLCKT
jgi:hypothetical protein